MEIHVVVGDPARWKKAMFGGDMMTEGVGEVLGGVGGNGLVEVVEGVLEVEDWGMWDVGGLDVKE